MTRQKFYIVTYGHKIYSIVCNKLEEAEKHREKLLAQGHAVKIKVGYRDD